ncbi:MAG TPA: hypothetical protein VGE70_11755 [Burkholderiaceae bacterium]
MPLTSDTPPNGDFARYVERLVNESARANSLPAAMAPTRPAARSGGGARAGALARPPTPQRPVPEVASPPDGPSPTLWIVAGGFAVAWVVLQVAALFVPAIEDFSGLLFMAFIVWAFFQIRNGAGRAYLARLREQIEKAAADAGKRP